MQVFEQRANGALLTLDAGSLRRHFELRGKILSIASGAGLQDEIMPPPREGRRLRLAFLADHFGPSAETYTTLPAFEQLDKERFEVLLFARQTNESVIEKHCRKHAAAFHVLPEELDAQIATLRSAAPDVLIFSANLTADFQGLARLALRRLAPLQIANHASPTTTGLPEIDLFMSSVLAETEQGAEHYVERLGLLPGAAHAFDFQADRQEPSATWNRAALGVPDDAILFVAAADAAKITPEMQQAWARLLTAVPGSRLLVHPFGLNGSTPQAIKRFCSEFDRVLTKNAVAGDRFIVSTNTFPSRADLNELLRLGDLCLDTYPCSDAGALVELLAVGVPVVAREGNTLRSRAGAALLRTLKFDELVAADERQYHDLVVRLAGDATARNELRARIEDRLSRSPVVFDPLAASDAFGSLVEAAYDDVLMNGTFGFRLNREPLGAPCKPPICRLPSRPLPLVRPVKPRVARSWCWPEIPPTRKRAISSAWH